MSNIMQQSLSTLNIYIYIFMYDFSIPYTYAYICICICCLAHEVQLNICFMFCICLCVCHYIVSNCLLLLGLFIHPCCVHEVDIYSVTFGEIWLWVYVVRVACEVLKLLKLDETSKFYWAMAKNAKDFGETNGLCIWTFLISFSHVHDVLACEAHYSNVLNKMSQQNQHAK